MGAAGQADRPAVPADDARVYKEPRARRHGDLKVELTLEQIEQLFEIRALRDATHAPGDRVLILVGAERVEDLRACCGGHRRARRYDPQQAVEQLSVMRPELDRN